LAWIWPLVSVISLKWPAARTALLTVHRACTAGVFDTNVGNSSAAVLALSVEIHWPLKSTSTWMPVGTDRGIVEVEPTVVENHLAP
jgi:hypothetical protein